MPKPAKNPLNFAVEAMNEAINKYGDFTIMKTDFDGQRFRLFFGERPDVVLLRRFSDLDGDLTSLYEHTPTGTRVLLREWTSTWEDGTFSSGALTVTARTMEHLATLVDILDNDEGEVESYLHTVEEARRHVDDRGDQYDDF